MAVVSGGGLGSSGSLSGPVERLCESGFYSALGKSLCT